jgi:hypothetical protein
MTFQITPGVHVRRDEQGKVRQIRHPQAPYTVDAAGLTGATPRSLGSNYVTNVAEIFELDPKMLTKLDEPAAQKKTDDGSLLQFQSEKTVLNTTVIGYQQTYHGLPIWEAGFKVHIQGGDLRASSAQSTVHYDVDIHRPSGKPKVDFDGLNENELSTAVKIGRRKKQPRINRRGRLIYRYDPDLRLHPEAAENTEEISLAAPPPVLPLPPASGSIKSGRHYEVIEILFTLDVVDMGDVNWRVFIEPITGSVLYLRALVSSAFGNVFEKDPLTLTGDVTVTPGSPATTLDPLTSLVTLTGLSPPVTAGDPQSLTGEFVELTDNSAPDIDAPTAALPTGNFSFSAITDDFAAVNAYYHCDWLFRLVADFGFNVATYFDGTTFPVPVDHRGLGTAVNAQAPGNATGDGSGGFRFALAQAGETVGIAADRRVVLHEFGHVLLWDHVDSPNFGFAHSAGDSLAAILCDPDSNVSDRFLTFPWITTSTPSIDRRHDRDVTAGWAWNGVNDVGGYSSEQILATTHFRIYRATGGDDSRQNVKEFAARYLAFLIIKATGLLTPATNPVNADEWATDLIDADLGNLDFEGHPGGAFHKVVRWGFEKQGLYQPPGAPTPVVSEGDPPEVDVYIDDGRNGEYQYQRNFWNTQDIWVRNAADGGLVHQTPIVNQPNYLYARVKNRGSQTAQNVVVSAYNCQPATGLVWPDDWQAMTTASLPSADIPSGASQIVGPFEWTPQVIGHECVLASVTADGDTSNADTVAGPIPHWRLVPFDNNIGQRNLAPVAGGGGSLILARSFIRRFIDIRNPFPRVVPVELEITLPKFLEKRNWKLRVVSQGGGRFTLGPRARKQAELRLDAGGDFSIDDVRNAGDDTTIDITAIVDGLPVGGMSYKIDPDLKHQPVEKPTKTDSRKCDDEAEKLLECLCLPDRQVDRVQIRRITVDIDLKPECD